ncbi:MAG: sulfatase [Calditrichia bacterium]|nr:sulfatase [Calditrichia bacterium]
MTEKISHRLFVKNLISASIVLRLSSLLLFLQISCGKNSPPNLVFVMVDQMRGQAMGFMGVEPVLTPSLDRFAQEAVVFTQAVSNYPVCSPSRGMLMTGMYPHSNGVLNNCTSKSGEFDIELNKQSHCWSDILKEKGYSLGYIGKWHLDAPRKPYVKCGNNHEDFAWNEWCSPDRRHGFDFWYAYGTFDWHLNPMYWKTDAVRDSAHWVKQWGPEHEADLAIKYIENQNGDYRNTNNPFALVISMNPPHMPYDQLPQRYVDKYKNFDLEKACSHPGIPSSDSKWGQYYRKHILNYYAMITGVDEQFGRILDVINKAGLSDNTIVIYTSDHGNCLGIHNQISKNNFYEESMRIPLIIRWPEKIKSRRENLLISVPDIYPTLLDLMGFANAIPREVEGNSFASLLRKNIGDRPTSQLYMKIPLGQPAWGKRGIRTYRYTMMLNIVPDRTKEIFLFDRENDPYQLENIAEKNPDIVQELISEELIPWLKRTNDPWLVTMKNVQKESN